MFFASLQISEVAYNIQQVSKFVVGGGGGGGVLLTDMTCGMVNIHLLMTVGNKNVWKQMLKITFGLVRDRGISQFPQLVDKSKCASWRNAIY